MIPPQPHPRAQGLGHTKAHRPRILLAEDDDEMRRLLASSLSQEGYEIVQAADGEQFVDLVTSSMREGKPIDLLISDVRMPGLTGFEALEWVRTLGCRAPVILITAFGDRWTHMEAVRQGVVRVLDKPFELETLRTMTRDLFHRRSRGGPADLD